jgi:DNA polymerase III alpha subunit
MLTRNRKLEEYRIWSELTDKEKDWILANQQQLSGLLDAVEKGCKHKKEGGACSTVGRVKILEGFKQLLQTPPTSLRDTPSWVAMMEEKILGVALTCSAIDEVDTSDANTTCKEFMDGKKGAMTLAVNLTKVKKIKTKSGKNPGQDMAFLIVSDGTCSVTDICVFPETWENYKNFLAEGNNVLLTGERDKKKGSFIVKRVNQI